MDDETNPHRVYTAWSEIAYHKMSGDRFIVSCGVNDNPTHATIQLRGGGAYPSIDFALPRQRHELSKVDLLMQRAYERGKADNRLEVGKFLKDLIAI